jgi:hypothetical protein
MNKTAHIPVRFTADELEALHFLAVSAYPDMRGKVLQKTSHAISRAIRHMDEAMTRFDCPVRNRGARIVIPISEYQGGSQDGT